MGCGSSVGSRGARSVQVPVLPDKADVARLREGLRRRTEDCRRALGTELLVIEALVRMGQLDGAVHALEGQRWALRALRSDLDAVIAGAVVEHAAEQAVDVRHAPAVGGRRAKRSQCRLALAVTVFAMIVVLLGLRHQPPRGLAHALLAEVRALSASLDLDDLPDEALFNLRPLLSVLRG